MKNILNVIIFMTMYLVPHILVEVEAVSAEAWPEIVALTSEGPEATEAISKMFILKRNASVRVLIDTLENAALPIRKRLAASNMLGELKASESVDMLMRQLILSPETTEAKSLETLYPCYYALTKIGISASRKALIRLGDEVDPLRRLLLCAILKEA